MEQEEKIMIKSMGEQPLKNVLQQHATIIDDKYYFLPLWFEKVENSNDFIVHHMEKLPKDLRSVIEKKKSSSPN